MSFFEHHVTVSSPENLVTVFLRLGYVFLNNPQTQDIHTKDIVYIKYSYHHIIGLSYIGISALIRRWNHLPLTVSFPIYVKWIFSRFIHYSIVHRSVRWHQHRLTSPFHQEQQGIMESFPRGMIIISIYH